MHNLILGNLKDHATTYLSISTAGSILEKKLEKQKNWKITRKRMVFHLLEPEYENVSIADSLSQGASVNNSYPDSSSASSSGSVSEFSKSTRYSARPNANQTSRDSSSQPGTSSRKRKKMSDIPAEATQACPNSPTEVTIKRTWLSQKESAAVAVTNEVPIPDLLATTCARASQLRLHHLSQHLILLQHLILPKIHRCLKLHQKQ